MGIKVLVVEDNQDYREVLQLFLELNGFQVVIAGDGREAVELAARERPNLILMDLNLPVLDGWEATRLITRDPATSNIPIIAVSANCDAGGEEALAAGAVGCVQKPVDITLIPELVLSYANRE